MAKMTCEGCGSETFIVIEEVITSGAGGCRLHYRCLDCGQETVIFLTAEEFRERQAAQALAQGRQN